MCIYVMQRLEQPEDLSSSLSKGNSYETAVPTVIVSHSTRDDMVQCFLRRVRLDRIETVASVLLSKIVDVAAGQICELFRPQSPEVPAHLSPAVELPVSTPEHNGFSLPVPQQQVAPTPPAEPTSTGFESRVDEMPHLQIPESSTAPDTGAIPELPREAESVNVAAPPTLC